MITSFEGCGSKRTAFVVRCDSVGRPELREQGWARGVALILV